MQASRPRSPHTPAAIKLPAYPIGNSSPEPNQTAAGKPTGYAETRPYPSHNSHNSHKSHASVTPPRFRIPPPPSNCPHTLSVTYRPSPTALRHSKPTGYHMACHGVARQGEDGRPRFVRQVRQARHKRHAPAPRKPPLPSSKRHAAAACTPPLHQKGEHTPMVSRIFPAFFAVKD